MTFKNPQDAFNEAIKAGLLSTNPTLENYAGNFMYMGTDDDGNDAFKNIDRRCYIYNKHK